ncbi:MAG TPA: 16S rRNA (uracil(1498)-N(3))-methyltransferase [Smithella sp.]|nr:16S rRNA (uracil(1498)-N(3))-methyltransferase [Smithella sp.]
MTVPRLYSPENLENQKFCELADDNLNYLKNVLRLKPGEKIFVFDGFGHEFCAAIKNFSAKTVLLELKEALPPVPKEISLTLAQAIPKARKMDIIVKSAAELGADKIIPFEAARSIGYVAREKSSAKISRWQKIALEAARSSHGAYIPQVAPVASFEEMLCAAPDRCVKLIFWEEESRNTIKDVLSQECLPPAGDFFVIVGPEGGFSREEISQAIQKGFQPVSMGKQILKVETAAAAILTIIQYEKGIFSHSSKEAKP